MYLYPVKVEFEDIDSYGIIHHPRLLYYLERARVHFFLDNGVDIATQSGKVGFVLRNISIQLKAQIVMFDSLNVEVRATNIDKYKFTFDYRVKKENKTMVTSQIEMVTIDLTTKKLIEIPKAIRHLLFSIQSCPE